MQVFATLASRVKVQRVVNLALFARLRGQLPRLVACGVVAAATVASACTSFLPSRPGSLDALGVRVGADWLQQATLHEDARLGFVTHVVKRAAAGEIAIVGTRAAVFLPAGAGAPRIVTFGEPGGHLELIEWPNEPPRYVDRGGGGWRTGALLGGDGTRLWQPDHSDGMDDLAAGDLDRDGVPEFVVGYNGGGGVRLLDAAGQERWRQADGNVWHVEIVDTDGDRTPEIVHSNASGQMTIRDASGSVLRRSEVDDYFSEFSLVQWPPPRTGVLHATDAGTDVVEFDGTVRVHLETPDTSYLCEARGTPARLEGRDHLVLTVSCGQWSRTQLFVFDEAGVLRYREVAPAKCLSVAAPEPGAFLFGCGSRVVRYTTTARSASADVPAHHPIP